MSQINDALNKNIDHTFAKQKEYALSLRQSDYRQRLAVLERFEKVFKAAYNKLYKAQMLIFKPQAEVDTSEILPVIQKVVPCKKNLKRWMKPKSVMPTMATFGTRSKIPLSQWV